MARLFFSTQQCVGADTTRRRYNADRKGFIHVENSQDLKDLKAGGYVEAGMVPRTEKYWVCDDCGRDCLINHCAKCDRDGDLRKVIG